MTLDEEIMKLDLIASDAFEGGDVNEFRQLAEWLRELKKYRIAHYKLRDMDYEYDLNSKFGNNPMYYGHKVWDLFGHIEASVEYEVMGYEEVKTDEGDSD